MTPPLTHHRMTTRILPLISPNWNSYNIDVLPKFLAPGGDGGENDDNYLIITGVSLQIIYSYDNRGGGVSEEVPENDAVFVEWLHLISSFYTRVTKIWNKVSQPGQALSGKAVSGRIRCTACERYKLYFSHDSPRHSNVLQNWRSLSGGHFSPPLVAFCTNSRVLCRFPLPHFLLQRLQADHSETLQSRTNGKKI